MSCNSFCRLTTILSYSLIPLMNPINTQTAVFLLSAVDRTIYQLFGGTKDSIHKFISQVIKHTYSFNFFTQRAQPARLPASLNRMVFMHPVNRLRSRHTRAFASKTAHETHAFSCTIDMHSCALSASQEKGVKKSRYSTGITWAFYVDQTGICWRFDSFDAEP